MSSSSQSSSSIVADPKWIRFVAGGAASCTAEVCTISIDAVKLRLQLQGQNGTTSQPRLGMLQMVKHIVHNEGVGGLFKGLSPALLRQASYSSIRVGIYEPIRQFYSGDSASHPTYFQRVAAGGTAGAIGISIANPTELIKIRMQADRSGTRYSGVLDAFSKIIKSEGVRGLWAGCLPNIQRAFIVNAFELGTYDQAKETLVNDFGMGSTSVLTHGAASFIAGFFATVGCNPVDVIKNRLMSQPTGEGRLYSGMLDCMAKTVRNEGVMALYKGFLPQWLRLGPWCMIMFISFEQYKVWCRNWCQ